MHKLKRILWALIGLTVYMAASFLLCYHAPRQELSFYLSGQGQPKIDVMYNNKLHYFAPELTPIPELFTVKLKADRVDELSFKISDYSGILHLSDIFISGTRLTQIVAIDGEKTQILNQSDGNLSLSVAGQTTVKICAPCTMPLSKKFHLLDFAVCLCGGILLLAIGLLVRMKRDKIKEKMLTIYTLKNYALIMPYVRPYWFRAMLAILITIPVGAMDAVIAWSLKPFMDIVLVEKQTGWTMYIPLMIIVFSILQALFTYLATYMNTWVGNKISLNVKRNLFNKLIHRDMSFFDATNSGEILFRYETDADMACGGLLNNMRLLSTRLFSSISLIIVLFYNSWKLAIVAVVVLFGALMPLTRIRKRLKKVVAKDVNVMAETMKHYNEAYSGNRIISAYNLFDYCKKKFVTTINDLFDLSIQIVAKTGIISPIMHVISSFGIAFVIWYGSHLIVTHQMTVGNFASFITSLVMLYNPIKSIGNNFSSVIFSLMAVERVFSVLQMPNKIQNNHKALCPPNIRGDIVYNDVSFAYQPNKPVLRHIHLDIKAGQTIALVGNSGGGKTTISTLLPRFYDVTGGEITIDGVNIKDFDLNYLRDNIAIVFQDNFLFGTTIRENILFGRTDVSEDDLQKAVEAACLSEFIATLDQGLDTQIGERGVTLSGGQKQRIAIARAFIKNAPILILDEATSALDNKSEAVVQQAIDNLMKDRTVLVIAHRLSTVRNADCIIVINNGEIAEKGSHEELLQNEGAYAALYKTQLV